MSLPTLCAGGPPILAVHHGLFLPVLELPINAIIQHVLVFLGEACLRRRVSCNSRAMSPATVSALLISRPLPRLRKSRDSLSWLLLPLPCLELCLAGGSGSVGWAWEVCMSSQKTGFPGMLPGSPPVVPGLPCAPQPQAPKLGKDSRRDELSTAHASFLPAFLHPS